MIENDFRRTTDEEPASLKTSDRKSARPTRGGAIVGVGALVATLLIGCASSTPGGEPTPEENSSGLEEMDPVVLRVSEIGPEQGTPAVALGAFMDDVRERSGGKIDFEAYYSSTLAPAVESLAAVQSGLTDIGFFGATFNPAEMPSVFWSTNAARSVIGTAHPAAALVGTPTTSAVYQTNPETAAESAGLGVLPLVVMHSSSFPMVCTDPVETPDQTAGKLAVTFGSPWKEEVESLGMTNISLPPAELYEGLQRGVADCVVSAPNNVITQNLFDVAKYLTLTEGASGSGSGYLINADVWESLPDEAKQILLEARASFVTVYVRETLESYSKLISEAERLGVTIHDPGPLNELIRDRSASVYGTLDDTAPETLTDPQAFLEALEEHRQYWSDFVADDLGIESTEGGDFDELLASYSESPDQVDWDDYEEALRQYLGKLKSE